MNKISALDYWRMGRARGWRYPIRYFFQSHWFDIVRGTNTHFWMPPEDYSRACPKGGDPVHYVACPTRAIVKSLRAIAAHAAARFGEFQFLDLGCGKGKALLVYAEYTKSMTVPPAVGIEIVPVLSHVAQENVKIAGFDGRIRIARGDARMWNEQSPNGPVILFLYNPFGKATLTYVLQTALERECYMAYVDPEHSTLLEEMKWTRIFRATGRYRNECLEVWHQNAQSASTSRAAGAVTRAILPPDTPVSGYDSATLGGRPARRDTVRRHAEVSAINPEFLPSSSQ